jgi:prepilin-type N-terminal cleavage/methylation domain-containing protein
MKQSGFTAIELLITLFIAAAFLMSGYQLYDLIIKDGGQTRAQARASNVLYDYLQRYKPNSGSPCPAGGSRTPLNNQSINVTSLSNATITVTISCPYSSGAYTTKTLVTLNYNYGTGISSSQETISNSTFSPAQAPCPTGFIVVPGSITYGTSDFCAMKYEAKQFNSTTPISTASGLPWDNINQYDAATYSANVAGCTGCHLITEAEWLTIAQNVLSVPSNWSSGTVGTGYIYSGHNNNAPAIGLAADPSDSNGYAGETSPPANQRRTLTLTNGEVIWDLAANYYEWTSGTSTTDQPGITGESDYQYKEWTNPPLTSPGALSPDPSPAATGLPGSSTWNSSNGIGELYSYTGETELRAFIRGGGWDDTIYAGVLNLYLNWSDGSAGETGISFRVSR